MNSYLLYVNLQLHNDISQKPITHSNVGKLQDTISGLFKNCEFIVNDFFHAQSVGVDWIGPDHACLSWTH